MCAPILGRMNVNRLLRPRELDYRLGYPQGRSARLARKGLIPHITLPDGEIRFDSDVIDHWLGEQSNGIAKRLTASEEVRSSDATVALSLERQVHGC